MSTGLHIQSFTASPSTMPPPSQRNAWMVCVCACTMYLCVRVFLCLCVCVHNVIKCAKNFVHVCVYVCVFCVVYQTYIEGMNERIRKQFAISNPFDFKPITYLKVSSYLTCPLHIPFSLLSSLSFASLPPFIPFFSFPSLPPSHPPSLFFRLSTS